MGTQPPPSKGAEPPPQFSAHFYCGQTAGCIKMPLGTDVGLSPGDYMLHGHPVHLPKNGAESPKFSAHVYCGQTVGSIKMPLGTKVGLSPGDFVFDGDPAPLPKKGAEPPKFSAMFIVAKRLDGSRWHWHRGRPQPRGLCLRWGPIPPPQKGGEAPIFSAHVYCGQTAVWIKMVLGMEV